MLRSSQLADLNRAIVIIGAYILKPNLHKACSPDADSQRLDGWLIFECSLIFGKFGFFFPKQGVIDLDYFYLNNQCGVSEGSTEFCGGLWVREKRHTGCFELFCDALGSFACVGVIADAFAVPDGLVKGFFAALDKFVAFSDKPEYSNGV